MLDFLSSFLLRSRLEPSRIQFSLVKPSLSERAEVCNVQACSNGDILAGAERYATLFRSRGAKPDQIVLISLKPEPALFYAFLGALLAGCVPSMMPFPSIKQDPALFWGSHAELFRHLGGGLFVTYPENVADVAANTPSGLLRILIPADADSLSPDGAPYHEWSPDAVCCLQHSSGTTGLKKGVALTMASIGAQISSYANAIQITSEDAIVSWLPVYHDMGFVTSLLMPLAIGNHSVLMSPFDWLLDPLFLFETARAHDGRFIWLPNFAFHHLASAAEDSDPIDLSNVKAFINCSEPCKIETFDLFARTFARWGVRPDQLQVCYAMAETVFAVSQTDLGSAPKTAAISRSALEERRELLFGSDDRVEIVSVGRPIEGLRVRSVGGAVGEIQVLGPCVFNGYFGRDSADAFDDGWYRTGDIGFLHDGELYVLGREKDVIIVQGKNVLAHEIEALVGAVPGVKPGRAVALGLFNAAVGSEEVVIVAELADTRARNEIRTDIRKVLESTIGLAPRRIELVEANWLVKSTSGKISRSENLRKYKDLITER
jgi:acyl-CoA synthetase (AMP-forming)/AMP-acid ligase II